MHFAQVTFLQLFYHLKFHMATITGIFNRVRQYPESPTSISLCSLSIVEGGKFTLVYQGLADTPAERDWRSEWCEQTNTKYHKNQK